MPQLDLFAPGARTIPIRLPLQPLPDLARSRDQHIVAPPAPPQRPLELNLPFARPPAQHPSAVARVPSERRGLVPAAVPSPQATQSDLAAPLGRSPTPAAPPDPSPALALGAARELAQGAAGGFANDLERLIEAFLLSAISNRHTRRAYRANILRAVRMTGAARIEQLSIGDLVAFRAAIVAADLSSASQALALFALRSFLTWADGVVGLPFPLKSARTVLRADRVTTLSPPAILNSAEVAAVIAAAPPAHGRRAMVLLFLGAGLRVFELCGLACSDVVPDSVGGAVARIKGKGRKDRFVPLHTPIVAELAAYLASTGRRFGSGGAIFLAHDAAARRRRAGEPITERSAARRIDRVLRAAGISKPVRVHGMRHTFSTAVILNGGTLLHLGDLLGHSSLVTTARYVSRLGLGLDDLAASIPLTLVGG